MKQDLLNFLNWYVKDEALRENPERITSIVDRYLNEINVEHQNETPNIRENKEEKKVCEHKRKFHSHSDQDYCPDCDKFIDEF